MTIGASVSVKELTKRYGEVTAADDIPFDIEAGSAFAFVGTDSARKSTIIDCLTTLVNPDAGQLTVAGHDLANHPDTVRTPARAVQISG